MQATKNNTSQTNGQQALVHAIHLISFCRDKVSNDHGAKERKENHQIGVQPPE